MRLIKLDINKHKETINRLARGEFLQSTTWFELLQREQADVEIFGLEAQGDIKAISLIVKKKIFGSFFYYYIPRGPLGEKAALATLLRELKKLKSKTIFFRIEPEERGLIISLAADKLNINKTSDFQPQKTLCLDFSLSAEELLNQMHPKTRYNIRLAEKKGIKVYKASLEKFDDFWELMEKTGARDRFRLHGKAHYANLLSAQDNVKLFLAEYNKLIIAGGLFSFFGDRVTYLHGASDNEHRNLMAPYLLQWTVIKEALRINNSEQVFRYYDFYGIDEKKWPGVTRFKLGFGGFIKEYPGTYDLISRPLAYYMYSIFRFLRRVLKV